MLALHIKQGLNSSVRHKLGIQTRCTNLLFVKDNQSENPFFPSVLTSLNCFLMRFWYQSLLESQINYNMM